MRYLHSSYVSSYVNQGRVRSECALGQVWISTSIKANDIPRIEQLSDGSSDLVALPDEDQLFSHIMSHLMSNVER